jgi:hypothetical protein
MANPGSPPARVHRVTTRRRTLRPLTCPLEPELLVAEFADELPPDIAAAVREHVAICAVCGARSLALKNPYQLLASLGEEPVHSIPDLREVVRTKARSHPALRSLQRTAGALGRNGVIAMTAVLGLGLLALLITLVFVLPASAQTTNRSSNGLHGVPAAGKSGVLYAETGKLVTVSDGAGNVWQVAEIIVIDERTGVVVRSLPQSNQPLHVAQRELLPAGVQIAGNQGVELTAPDHNGSQALVVFNAKTGFVEHVVTLRLPDGKPLPTQATALALAPDGSMAYVGIVQNAPTLAGPRVIVIDVKTGAITGTLNPGLNATIPLPPPPGSLPSSAFPSTVPQLNAVGMIAAPGLNGALAISPDGQWLFDVVTLANAQGVQQYAVVRRFSVTDGTVAQQLALPGDFTLASLAGGLGAQSPQVYLVRGSPNAECFVLDASAQGPTLLGDIPLGGPVAKAGTTFSGTLILAPSTDSTRLFIGQDVARSDGRLAGHDLWVVDTQGMGLVANSTDPLAAGALLPNPLGNGQSGAFLLRDGQIELIAADLSTSPVPWLRLPDGRPIVALLAVESA